MDNQLSVSNNFNSIFTVGQRYEVTGFSNESFEYIFEGTYVGDNEFENMVICHLDANEDEMSYEDAFMTMSDNYKLLEDDNMCHDVITSVKAI